MLTECEDRQPLKHLFYKNISEWDSEVSILTAKDFMGEREVQMNFQQKDGRFQQRSRRHTERKYIYIDCNYSRMSERSCAKD